MADYEKEIDNDNLTITNSYEPETTELKVTKVWDDVNDQDGKRPNSVKFTVTGSDGNKYAATLKPAEGETGNTWTATIKNVAKYYDGGKEVTFTVDEQNVSGYEKSIDNEKLTITNSYTPETTKIKVTKVWDDASDQDGKRPESVKFTVTGSDDKTYEAKLSGDGDTWTAEVEVEKYYDGGKEVTFTVDEEDVDGYEKEVDNDNLTITNSYEPETTELKVTKIWDDADDQDGKRPESVKFTVTGSDGNKYEATLSGDGNTWTATIEDVAKYYDGGKEVTFEVTEETVSGYTIKSTDNKTLTITNTHEPEKYKITVTKVWVDENNKFGLRPDSVKFTVTGDDENTYEVTLKGTGDTWTAEVEVIKYHDGGKEVEFTVDEEDIVAGYAKDIEGLTITNTFKPWWGDPPVKKEISGDEPAKAETFTFKLKAVSFKKDENSAEDLTGNMPMPEGANGQEMTMDVKAGETKEFGKFDLVVTGVYTYTITEVTGEAEGYSYSDEVHTIVYTVTADEDNSLKCVKTVDGVEIDAEKETDEENVSKFTFTNEYTKPVVSVKVSKVWEDNNNEELTRPDSVTVKLLADGKDTGKTLELSKATEWAGTFENLDKYDAEGNEIKYTVDEAEIPEGYSAVVSGDAAKGFVITNSLVPPTGDTSDIFLWSGLSMTSLLGLGYLFFRRKKEDQ